MARESPYTRGLFREWERLLLLEPIERSDPNPLTEQVEGWQRLCAETRCAGEWRVSAADAALVASLGITIALRQREYARAATLAQEFLGHPDASGDEIDRNHLATRYAAALILLGRVEEGLAGLAAELKGPDIGPNVRRAIVRNTLVDVLGALDPSELLDRRLATFAGFMLSDWPGHRRKAAAAARCTTIGQLLATLDRTYKPRPGARAR